MGKKRLKTVEWAIWKGLERSVRQIESETGQGVGKVRTKEIVRVESRVRVGKKKARSKRKKSQGTWTTKKIRYQNRA